MKQLSLQWRITLLTSLLIFLSCLATNFLSYGSGLYYMDTLISFFTQNKDTSATAEYQLPIESDIPIFSAQEPNGDYIMDISIEPGILENQQNITIAVTAVQERYRITNCCITAAVSLCSGAIAYFVSGRALVPLKKIKTQVEQVELNNLSAFRLDEDVLPEFQQSIHSLNEMLERLDHASTAQRQFIGNAAHELRTPLALMQAKLELFRQEHLNILPVTVELLDSMQEQLKRLSLLAKTLLEMSDLQSFPKKDHIEFAPMLEEICADLAPLAYKKNITLEYEGDAKMIGSDTLIFRLIFNLAENAIKYNRQDGFVKLSVMQDGDLIQLRIRDTGFGISKEMQNSIFEPFFRVDKSRSRSLGGAGLGLSMVHEIVKLHSGSVCVEESSSAGTVFLVLLPSI